MASCKNVISNLCFWTILGAYVSLSWADRHEIPDVINLNVMSTERYDESIHVNLVPTESFLANRNLPVWVTSDKAYPSLIPQDTMEKVGPFTPYWDSDTCSAALYFHKTRQFEGNIGPHYTIHKLTYDLMTRRVKPTAESIFLSLLQNHRNYELKDHGVAEAVNERVKSLRPFPRTVYVETLIIIDYDTTNDFDNDYVSIVMYVLSLFNTVDMLYSQIEKPNIKINIAGIIIATKPFRQFTSECHRPPELGKDRQGRVLIALSSLRAVRRVLADYIRFVPLQTYDIAVLLTSASLVHRDVPTSTLLGIALPPKAQYKRRSSDVGIAIASHAMYFGNFPTIAHEIAHLLGVPHHEGPLFTEDGKCIGSLMRPYGTRCIKCLRFGGNTPQHLESFFSSRAGCIFHNKPRSLNPPHSTQLFWTPCEQCECYGFESVRKPPSCLRLSLFSSKLVNCKSTLKCLDQYGVMGSTSVYMDGTPCARNWNGISVCWNHKCVRLPTDSTTKRENYGAV